MRPLAAFAQGGISRCASAPQIRLDGVMTDLNSKPELDFPEGPAPEQLDIVDIVVGDGAEATPGATVDVHYLGVEYDTGEEFDSSWNRGQSINFPLGSLIAGWQQGIPGMKVGGRRKLTVPAHLAYGPAGSGHRLSGKTLIFVIDLLGVS
jgi:FKBP-type peptidyl-prolyl cis-trans isomerase